MTPEEFFEAYQDSLDDDHPHLDADFTAWSFGDNPDLIKTLLNLVLEGKKTATSSCAWEYEVDQEDLPQVGELSVILDSNGIPACIIETTEVRVMPYGEVDSQFAADEGEGDLSLMYWREAHWRWFSRVLPKIGREPTQDMPIVCERFQVIFKRKSL